MKISIIHNTYKDNPFIRESVILNLKALEEANVDYQYIVFNDNGHENIKNYVEDLPVTYHYSDYNFGMKICSGGWVGAIPLLEGELIHNTGQDDVFTSLFYRQIHKQFVQFDYDLVYCNGIKVNDDLTAKNELMGTVYQYWNYESPREVFNNWMGVQNNKITKANNYIPAPGTIYKKSLHEEIGIPDLNFGGVCDFEYWVRILFMNKKIRYIELPCWLYRMSEYTASKQIVDGKVNERDLSPIFIEQMKDKYQRLLDNEN